MLEIIMRLGILLLLAIGGGLLVLLGGRFVESQRRRALSAAPPSTLAGMGTAETATNTAVRILSFSSPDCQQCKKLQAPALERLLEARGEAVTVIKVDATTDQDLVRRYRVLTVPSTVVLNTEGKAHAINYGFADTHLLLTQIDEVLAKAASVS